MFIYEAVRGSIEVAKDRDRIVSTFSANARNALSASREFTIFLFFFFGAIITSPWFDIWEKLSKDQDV